MIPIVQRVENIDCNIIGNLELHSNLYFNNKQRTPNFMDKFIYEDCRETLLFLKHPAIRTLHGAHKKHGVIADA